MEHSHALPEFLHIFEEYDVLRGFIFGLVHTIIPLIGYYSGWSINRLLKIISNGYIAGLVGVVLAHVIADFVAATLDPHLKSAAIGIVYFAKYSSGRNITSSTLRDSTILTAFAEVQQISVSAFTSAEVFT